MSLVNDIEELKSMLVTLSIGQSYIINNTNEIKDKLALDIERKLDKALSGNTKTVPVEPQKDPIRQQKDPIRQLYQIRLAIVFATSNRKIDAIKALREATGAGLTEAKETADWIEERMAIMAQNKEDE